MALEKFQNKIVINILKKLRIYDSLPSWSIKVIDWWVFTLTPILINIAIFITGIYLFNKTYKHIGFEKFIVLALSILILYGRIINKKLAKLTE